MKFLNVKFSSSSIILLCLNFIDWWPTWVQVLYSCLTSKATWDVEYHCLVAVRVPIYIAIYRERIYEPPRTTEEYTEYPAKRIYSVILAVQSKGGDVPSYKLKRGLNMRSSPPHACRQIFQHAPHSKEGIPDFFEGHHSPDIQR